ncbi:MAG: DNA-binding protein [Candidatus Helarchaeota archaeon]
MSEDDELERLRKKRMEKFQKRLIQAKEDEARQKKFEEEQKKKEEEFEANKLRLLKAVLFPDAYVYFTKDLSVNHPKVAEKILITIIHLISQNQLAGKVSKNDLIILKRRILGIGPKIKVKFQGDEEPVELSKKLKELS